MENTSNYSIYFANSNLDITGNSKNKTSAITQSYSYTNDFIRKLNYLDGSFSQRLYVAYNDSRDKTDYLSQYFQKSDDSTQSTHINNYNPLKQKSTSITGISSLTFKISPATSFLGFYSATYINSTANNQAFDKDSIILSKLTPIDSLNNSWDFKQRQNFILLGLNVNTTKFEGSFNFNWLIRKQEIFPSNSKAAEINWNFMYPRIDLTYYFNKTTILNYTLNYEPSNISPSQLITTKNFQNPLIVQSGNPNLKNPTKQNMTLRFSSFNPKSLSNSTTILTYSATNQKIVNNVYFDSLGRQVLTPINLDHSKMLSWGTTWSKPFFKRRLAINLRNNILYANDPVAVSGILGTSESLSISPSIAINYTKKDLIDIQSSFAANRTYSTYNLGAVTKNEVTSLTMNLDVTGYLPLGFIAGVKYNKVINSGLAAGFNRSIDLLNVFVSKRLLKNKMEIKAQGFDLLNKNNSFTRTFTPTYFEDTQSTVLQRFFMGSIIYYIK
nr:outer membrane beta-barrel protein [Chitinophaga sp. CB10]